MAQKNKGSDKAKKGIRTALPLGASSSSKKSVKHNTSEYHYAPKTGEQKRADEWADIEAMENCERLEIDREQSAKWAAYQRAEKDAQREDINNGLIFFYTLSIFLMGYFLSYTILGLAFAFPAFFSYYALKLRGGYSLTQRSEGDRR